MKKKKNIGRNEFFKKFGNKKFISFFLVLVILFTTGFIPENGEKFNNEIVQENSSTNESGRSTVDCFLDPLELIDLKEISGEQKNKSNVELINSNDIIGQINNSNINEFEDLFPDLKNQSIDFTDKITKVTISIQEGEVWVPADKVNDGDRVKVKIDYQLGANDLIEGNTKIHYHMPSGIKVLEEQRGSVESKGEEAGSYVITQDGMINIEFNSDFIELGVGIDGCIQFEAQVTKEGVDDSGEIDFIGDGENVIIIVPEDPVEDNSDIKVKKSGQINSDKTEITYEVVVSTIKGTKQTVSISDGINQWESKNIDYFYDKNSLQIVKVEVDGTKNLVDSGDYHLEWIEKNTAKDCGFSITNLPALKPGEKYVVNYKVNIQADKNANIYIVYNSAFSSSGGENSSENNIIKWFKDLKKTGTYDPFTKLISWSIEINPEGKDLSGWIFKDEVKGEIVGDVKIHSKNSSFEEIIQVDGNQINYYFDSNKLSEEGKTDTYIISYNTKPPEGATQVENIAEIEGGDRDKAIVEITEREKNLSKVGESSQLVENNITENKWNAELIFPEGKLQSFIYEDFIGNAKNKKGENLGDDSHYGIATQLEQDLIKNLVIQINDTYNYKYQGNGKLVLHNDKGETDEISIKVTYFDKNNNIVLANDSTTKVKSFTITITPKSNFELQAQSLSISEYRTYTDLTYLADSDTVISGNIAKFGDITRYAEVSYEKLSRVLKETYKETINGMDIYQQGSSEISYDKVKGKIKYRLILKTSQSDTGDIIIKDIIPQGAKFVESSLKGRFYVDNYTSSETNYNGFTFRDGINPNYKLANKDGVEELTVNISNYKYSDDYPLVAIYYELDISEDEHWKDLTNSEKEYVNKVIWGENSSTTETTIKRDPKKINKNGQQLGCDGNPLVNPDGTIAQEVKPSNKIKYTVIINPKGEDLVQSSNTLTLVDTLHGAEGLNPVVDIDSVKLYRYDPRQEGNKGNLVPDSSYSLKYNVENRQLTMKIPDETGFVLEYIYIVDPNFAGDLEINNYVSLAGEWSSTEETILKDMTSSATATKKTIKIYKVDEDNYKKLLPGTKFKIDYFDRSNKLWKTKESEIVVGEKGYIQWNLSGSNRDLEADTLYRLTETYALEGYKISEKPTYFIWADEHDTATTSIENSGASDAKIPKEDIYVFSNCGGIKYISNKYTRLAVHKIWQDAEGNIIAPPKDKSIDVKLIRQKTKDDGYEVKVVSKSTASWVHEEKDYTVLVNKKTGSGVTINFNCWLENPEYSYDGKSRKLENNTLTIPSIKKDTIVTITHNSNHPGKALFTNYDKPELISVDREEIETVTLNEENKWSYSWDGLEYQDENGKDYYYTIEELPIEGYSISYTNNEGIQTGDINVINTADFVEYELPETGGFGTRNIYITSMILLVLSFLFYIWNKEKTIK
ncbi:Cna B-type domain-containing protein [Anaerosphaera multitolerans]|nr:Cna B-type domain-containing protein [Anaerosphaera multitolerans]